MTLIEDARRLKFTPWEDSCHLTCESCGADGAGEGDPFPHEVGCPWLALPKIVAALEAAERLSVAVQEHLGTRDNVSWQWPELAEPADALVAALKA